MNQQHLSHILSNTSIYNPKKRQKSRFGGPRGVKITRISLYGYLKCFCTSDNAPDMNSQCNNTLSKSLRHILEVGGTLGDPKGVKKKQYVHADRPLKRQIMLFLRISVRTMVSQDVPQDVLLVLNMLVGCI